MDFDLWSFFVEQVFGGFWIAVFGIALLIFLIISVFGRLSKMTSMHYILMYFMVMAIGYGYKTITVLIGFAILSAMYIEIKNYYSN